MTVYVSNLGERMYQATTGTLNSSYDTTDLNVSYISQPSYSGSGETDIIYRYNSALPLSSAAQTWCDDNSIGNLRCDQFYVEYSRSLSAWKSKPNAAAWFQHVACHETGHAVGLTHAVDADWVDPNNSSPLYNDNGLLECLKSPVDGTYTLGDQNVYWINQVY